MTTRTIDESLDLDSLLKGKSRYEQPYESFDFMIKQKELNFNDFGEDTLQGIGNRIIVDNLDDSWNPGKDSELDPREIYMNHCSKLGIDPTFEFIFALNDRNIKSCILSNRKKLLVGFNMFGIIFHHSFTNNE